MHDFRLAGEIANDRNYESVSSAIMAAIHQFEPPARAPSQAIKPTSATSAQGRLS
jgi:hypothetical protein